MALSQVNAKLLTAFALAIERRSYSAIASRIAPKPSGSRTMKQVDADMVKETPKCSWIPDPITGHYRPENSDGVVDAADLRRALLHQHLHKLETSN